MSEKIKTIDVRNVKMVKIKTLISTKCPEDLKIDHVLLQISIYKPKKVPELYSFISYLRSFAEKTIYHENLLYEIYNTLKSLCEPERIKLRAEVNYNDFVYEVIID